MKAPNIIILDGQENLIRWLDPELCDIEETEAAQKCRKIKLTYPYENQVILEDEKQWYENGNKIYVPSINGITSCLYVINTDYQIDFWKENKVIVEAEEVLTELNYNIIGFHKASVVNLTREKLQEWFGEYYDIDVVDAFSNNRAQVSPEGIMTLMSLYRLIEEQTERTFITEYYAEDNKIHRTLSLKNLDSTEFISDTESLDLNYNLESLEFTKSEENTYNAIAPVFSTAETTTISGADINNMTSSEVRAAVLKNAETNTKQTNYNPKNDEIIATLVSEYNDSLVGGETSLTMNTSKTHDELLEEWLDYEVITGQEIPMILKEDDDGNLVTTATWFAPFTKLKGDLYMFNETVNRADYNKITPYKNKANDVFNECKCMTSTTSETLMESIYNDLAVTLLAKLEPKFELKIDVKDIQLLLGRDDLGYQLHQLLEIRVPNFNYFVPCRIIETTKNLHLPGENKIKVSTDVVSVLKLVDSEIESNNIVLSKNETPTITGLLTASDTTMKNRTVTLNVRLEKAFTDKEATQNADLQQQVKKFDPANNTYYFPDSEIQRLEKALRYALIKRVAPSFKLRDIKGYVYSLNIMQAEALYFARNQLYIDNEEAYGGGGRNSESLGKGYFEETIPVHEVNNPQQAIDDLYENEGNTTTTFEKTKEYYWSLFMKYAKTNNEFSQRYWGDDTFIIGSSERQNGPTCVPAATSNITSQFFMYHTEYELAQRMGTENGGTRFSAAEKVFADLGLEYETVEATAENIQEKAPSNRELISLIVDANALSEYYYDGMYNQAEGYHNIVIYDWGQDPQLMNGRMFVRVLDSNIPVYSPLYPNLQPDVNDLIDVNTVLNAACSIKLNGEWVVVSGLGLKQMTVVKLTDRLLPSTSEFDTATVNISQFDPDIATYIFVVKDVFSAIADAIKSNVNAGITASPMSLYAEVKSASGVPYTIDMYFLRAIMLYMSHRMCNSSLDLTNSTIQIDSDAVCNLLYKHMNVDTAEVGVYDWFTPVDAVYSQQPRVIYILATLLGYLGLPKPVTNMKTVSETFEGIKTQILKSGGSSLGSTNLHAWIIDNDATEMKKYLGKAYSDSFMYTVMLAYAKDSSLHAHARVTQTNYPLLLYSIDGDTVYYQNIMGAGNSTTSNYSTSRLNATNSPFGSTTVSNMVAWIDVAKGEAPSGSKNQILVLSWFTKKELEENT